MGKYLGLGAVILLATATAWGQIEHSRHFQSRTTHVAKSCEYADVNAAVTLARSGDTVLVPPGSCAWASSLDMAGKDIALRGSGVGSTNITREGTLISLGTTTSVISDFTLIQTSASSSANSISVNARARGWRIHHNRIESGSWTNAITTGNTGGSAVATHQLGLADNNHFINTRVLAHGDIVGEVPGNLGWSLPLALGTDKAVYVEGNTYLSTVFTNAIDGNYGGAYVFRHNDVTDTYVEAHASRGSERGFRKVEVYRNRFRQVSETMFWSASIRSGTGVLFENTLTGTWPDAMRVDNRRSFEAATGDGGNCDGTSAWDGNEEGELGWPCRDQIGRSTDAFLWTDSSGIPSQESAPLYVWSNTRNGASAGMVVHNCGDLIVEGGSCTHIVENRDFFNSAHPSYEPYPYPHPNASGVGEVRRSFVHMSEVGGL